MIFGRFVTAAVVAFALASAALAQDLPPGNDSTTHYRIQPGDLLEISVWREEYLEREVIVQPDGRVSFPLVGVLDAAGTTVEQVQARVAERLAQYIPDPVVTVSIKEINGNRVYVLGQVNNPGQFIMNPTIDVIQALALAGGTTPFAELNEIKILRRDGGSQRLIEFRYADMSRGRNLDQNVILQSGDVIIVP
ncbi:MAG: polysaccharide export protein [Burkholderiales bacterium]|nr:polysaccharide export protein [Burkholderiales bacterium]